MPSVESYRRRKAEIAKLNEQLAEAEYQARKWEQEARVAKHARYIDHLRHEQMKKLLEAYQNQILGWYNLQVNPPTFLVQVETVGIPNCLKPFDSIKYVNRDKANELVEFFEDKKSEIASQNSNKGVM